MTIIVFLVDTSASMNQRSYLGTTLLDLTKGAVETFLKYRQRDPSSRSFDRYMLLTFEDPPHNVKAGWKENQATFMQELKDLKATGLTSFGFALGNAFHLLNINRLQTGIDTYGLGRCPHNLEPVVIVSFSDGGSLLSTTGAQKEVTVEMPPFPGNELTLEPFRWDQRLFSLILRIPGTAPAVIAANTMVPTDISPINLMCEVTGGRSYCVTNHKALNQVLESLVQKLQPGVVLQLEKIGPDPMPPGHDENFSEKRIGAIENGFVNKESLAGINNLKLSAVPSRLLNGSIASRPSSPSILPVVPPDWHFTKKMIFVPRVTNRGTALMTNWPIPEPFWTDPAMPALPPRSAHPVVRFKCEDSEVIAADNFPFDKYELEPSPLTQFVLMRKQPTACWPVFVPNSGRVGDAAPFGYIKASTSLTAVNLFVMPYNYPVAVPLINDLIKSKCKVTPAWKFDFDKYMKNVPAYYIPVKFYRRAFQHLNMNPNAVLPENTDCGLNPGIHAYIKGKVKVQAREEFERLCSAVTYKNELLPVEGVKIVPRSGSALLSGTKTLNRALTLLPSRVTGDLLHSSRVDLSSTDFPSFTVRLPAKPNFASSAASSFVAATHGNPFRNAFDIPRSKLLEQVSKMRKNVMHILSNTPIPVLEGGLPGIKLRLQNAEELHTLPIAQMGNYQQYLMMLPKPLRDIEAAPVRQHAFGNPFKVDKRMFVDEADIDSLVAAATGSADRPGGVAKPARRPVGSNDPPRTPASMPPKRKSGPLPKSFRYHKRRRTESDVSSVQSGSSDFASETASISSSTPDSPVLPIEMEVAHPDGAFEAGPTVIEREAAVASEFVCKEPYDVVNNVSSRPKMGGTSSGSKQKLAKAKPKQKKPLKVVTIGAEQLAEAKRNLSTLVRTPGRNSLKVLAFLKRFHKSVRSQLVPFAIEQAQHFKRKRLQELLEKFQGTRA